MSFLTKKHSDRLTIFLDERLDAFWAKSAEEEFDEILREDHHQLELNLKKSVFLSSAGIRVILILFKKIQSVNGSLYLSEVKEPIEKVLQMSGLSKMLIRPETAAPVEETIETDFVLGDVHFETFPSENTTSFNCCLLGDPAALTKIGYHEQDVIERKVTKDQVLLGLGSIGDDWKDCESSFGELISINRVAAYLPTDGKDTADYMLGNESFEPTMQILSGIHATGGFSHFTRFKSNQSGEVLGLSDIAESTLRYLKQKSAVVVMVAESAGLTGVRLKKSPALVGDDHPLLFPDIRKWFTLTPEKTHVRNLTLVLGVITKDPPSGAKSFFRPLNRHSDIMAHFHAAPFSYRIFKRGKLDLDETLQTLFEGEVLHDVLHLINDDRSVVGIGESEFKSGALWASGLKWQQ